MGDRGYVAPTSNNGNIIIDGSISVDEWDLSKCGVPMWEAGDSGKPNPILFSEAWFNWDCKTETLCILVKTVNETLYVLKDEDNSSNRWFKGYPLNAFYNFLSIIRVERGFILLDSLLFLCNFCHGKREDFFFFLADVCKNVCKGYFLYCILGKINDFFVAY